jgi:kinesin family protein 2/24
MMGKIGAEDDVPGMYDLAARDIFTLLDNPEFNHLYAQVSFYEIYCSKLFDLLNNREFLHCREDKNQKVVVQGLTQVTVHNEVSLLEVLADGLKERTTGQTGANVDSSRSHAVLSITLKSKMNGKVFGIISFIDLAGSERGADTVDTDKQTRIDGAEINKSLLALKECIRAIDLDKKHTPFRGSKLTQVLKDSFRGNCKTVMIATVSPGSSCSEHTLNTMRYADRVKELKKEQVRSKAD